MNERKVNADGTFTGAQEKQIYSTTHEAEKRGELTDKFCVNHNENLLKGNNAAAFLTDCGSFVSSVISGQTNIS